MSGLVESIRFERQRVPCDVAVTSYGYSHERWRYTVRWTGPDGVEHVETEYRCWHPCCDESPWIRLMGDLRRADPIVTSWVRHDGRAMAVAYILRVYQGFGDPGRSPGEPVVVPRVGVCSQWEHPQLGNYHGELFSRRYYAADGCGVYPASFIDM